jgi:hypothetical protein
MSTESDAPVCEHGSLARACLTCELQSNISELQKQLHAMIGYGDTQRHRAKAAETIAADRLRELAHVRKLGDGMAARWPDRASVVVPEEVDRWREFWRAKP